MARVQPPLACAAASLLVFGMAAPAAASPGDVITLADPSLSASGALAADPARDVYWTAAGSGAVQAINPDGSTAGEVSYAAAPTGVEALAMFDGALYVGDVGGARSAVTVYRLNSMDYGTSAAFTQWTLHYPDGAHDAMTMMVSPRGNIWIVTKGSPGGLYYVEAPGTLAELTLERVADAPDWVTDGVFTDGSTAVLRTYSSVLTFDMMDYAVTAAEVAPAQPQGESVTTSLDATGLVLGSRNDDRLLEVTAPTTMADVGEAPSTPPGTATVAEPTEAPTTAVEEAETTSAPTDSETQAGKSGSGRGRYGALAIAALVSVVAGGIAYLTSKPPSKHYRRRH